MNIGFDARPRRTALERGQHVAFAAAEGPLAFGAALAALREDPAFRALVLETLRAAPFRAFFWETPPIARAVLGRPFEWVVLDAPILARAAPDPGAFADVFAAAGPAEAVVAFPNQGGDALLVAPRPPRAPEAWRAFGHLAAFVRGAPEELAHALLARVATEAEALLGEAPLWISTSGAGVAWLHVRLDVTPKYHQHHPYRAWDPPADGAGRAGAPMA